MATVVNVFAEPDDTCVDTPLVALRRTAFYLESQGQPLFAWLHYCAPGTRFTDGVILCPPVGYEQVHAHRSLRHLADALAWAGLPVLRFDYHGTGDSAGIDEDGDRHATWLANIRDAATWMRRQLGCRRLSLVGVRLGASLAMEVAAVEAVDNLVLWAPVVKGRAYVREMKALSLTAAAEAKPVATTPDDIEAAGFVLTRQTAEELGRLDLFQVRPQCRRLLIVARDDVLPDTRLVEHLAALGIAAEQVAQPGYADMMAEPHFSKAPQQAIACIREWLVARLPAEEQAGAGADLIQGSGSCFSLAGRIGNPPHDSRFLDVTREDAESPAALLPYRPYTQEPLDTRQCLRERVFWICREQGLFGIVSEPEHGSPKDLPTIVLVNAGSAYRVGPGRLYVHLARQLAAQGFRCLRMDLGGLGDSDAAVHTDGNDPYAATAFRDIERAVKRLQTHLGVQRVVLMGLCSGAYFAFQSAAQLSSPVLVESVMINPLTYYWKEGMSLKAAPAERPEFFHYFLNAALEPKKWWKMLSGRSKLSFLGAFKILWRWWRVRQRTPVTAPPDHCAATLSATPSHPPREDLPADLDRVAAAGRRLAFFFARSDPGYSILMLQARRQVKKLRRAGKLDVFFLDGADHTFSSRTPRRSLVRAISEFFCHRYQPTRQV